MMSKTKVLHSKKFSGEENYYYKIAVNKKK